VQLDEALGEREAEARALGLARGVGLDLLELAEQAREVLDADPDARRRTRPPARVNLMAFESRL
jgi:hypothetical protein